MWSIDIDEVLAVSRAKLLVQNRQKNEAIGLG